MDARDPDERRTYEENRDALFGTIVQVDSPFRHYRESYIGALRSGSDVPLARELDAELTGQDGYHSLRAVARIGTTAVSRPGSRTPGRAPTALGHSRRARSVIPERAPHGMALTGSSGRAGRMRTAPTTRWMS